MEGRKQLRQLMAALLLVTALITVGAVGTYGQAGTASIRILHVTIVSGAEVSRVITIAGAKDLVSVDSVSLHDLCGGAFSSLMDYDVVVFGINDGYEDHDSLGAGLVAMLDHYVINGGGIVWTHDSLEWGEDHGPEIEAAAGVDYEQDHRRSGGDEVEFPGWTHPILRQPYNVRRMDKVQGTHTTGGRVTTATVIARFVGDRPSSYNFYLTVNEYGAGRVVVTQIGHSFWGYWDGRQTPTTIWPERLEAQLFVNCLFWAAGRT